MKQLTNKHILIISGIATAIFVAGVSFFFFPRPVHAPIHQSLQKVITATPTMTQAIATFSYAGQEGKDALTLLQKQAIVGLAPSGLVISINGKKADDAHHEYWAFYINGKLASVGPKAYITHNSDTIMWKIETY